MVCREIIADCYEKHTKHIYELCGQNVEALSAKVGGPAHILKLRQSQTTTPVFVGVTVQDILTL
jgi:hypothetical protein